MKKKFWLRLLQRFNPNTYENLCQDSFKKIFKEFWIYFGLLFLIMSMLFIPAFFYQSKKISERFNQFETFNISVDLKSNNGHVLLLDNPSIAYDNRTNISSFNEKLLFGADKIYYNKYYWFGKKSMPYNKIKDFHNLNKNAKYGLALFIWPGLIFWSGIFLLVKSLLIIIIFSFFGWLIMGAINRTISFKKSIKISLIAIIPSLFVEMILFPFYRSWLGIMMFILFYVLGIILVSEKKLLKKNKRNKYERIKKNNEKEYY